MGDVSGLLIIDKPEGLTSHDVVVRVRRALGIKRIGHTGTLDPMATGVLVLCVGQATRLQQFLTGSEKEYLARVRLGLATDTHDRTGNPLSPIVASNGVMKHEIEAVLAGWRGWREQIPPMYSAKKQAGTRLYKLARQGREVARQPVRVQIHELELVGQEPMPLQRHADGTTDFSLRVRCSAGTYIRSLAHQIGQQLGCGAHLIALRRTAVGPFSLDQARPLHEVEQQARAGRVTELLIPLSQIPLPFPTTELSSVEADRLRHGQAILRTETTEGVYRRLVDTSGMLIGIGQVTDNGQRIQPCVVFC